jgi:hypothetical protein
MRPAPERPRRRSRDLGGRDDEATVALLVFEAADLLAAIPAAEVRSVRASDLGDPAEPGAAVLDLGVRFGAAPRGGPWLEWQRGAARSWLRVDAVKAVVAYRLCDLVPLPARLARASAFWAAAAGGDEVVLLLDPARL